MSAEKPPTLRQQFEELRDSVNALVDMETDRQRVMTNGGSRPPMTEARALDVCMTALADLQEQESNRNRNNYGFHPALTSGDVTGRILRHLAERFGVNLIEVRREPCDLAHVDHGAVADLAEVVRRLSNGALS